MNKKSYAILGLGKFGKSIALELSRAGADVLAVDINETLVREAAPYVTHAVKANLCDQNAMESLGLSNIDVAVIAASGRLDASVTATIFAKEAGVPFIIAKAQDEIQSRILKKVGADRVLIPEHESGVRVAHSIMSDNFIDFIELSDRIRLIETPIRREWVGKSLSELGLRKKYKVNVIAVRHAGGLDTNIDPQSPLPEGCTILLTADRNDISKLISQ